MAEEYLNEITIRKSMENTKTIGQQIIVLPTVTSTNDYAKSLASTNIPNGTVVISTEQTAGRGRRGRTFYSAKNQGLYLSILLYPPTETHTLLSLTGLSAVAVRRTIAQCISLCPSIKWVNDILLCEKKVAGILVEMGGYGQSVPSYLVIGIGINLQQKQEEFQQQELFEATSLWLSTGKTVSINEIAGTLIREFDELYQKLLCQQTSDYIGEYRNYCTTLGKDIQLLWSHKKEYGTALDIDEAFGLIVKDSNGIVRTIRSGEVSVRPAESKS